MSAPTLARVTYALFPHELSVLDEPGSDRVHAIDREIQLEMSDGKSWFVSWTSKPEMYSVGVAQQPFFQSSESMTIDASRHPMWRNLIGHPIEFVPVNAEFQIVQVQTTNGSVYLSSQENGAWAMDVITVSVERPVVDA